MRKVRLMSILTLFLFMGVSFVACDNVKDSDLENKAVEVITNNPVASNVVVVVQDKVATLSGSVEDDATKGYVGSSIEEIKGIKSVVNNIIVVPPAPDYTELDANIRTALPDVLKEYPNVQADVKDGVVTLTGELIAEDAPQLKDKVTDLNPVKVVNNIVLKYKFR